MHHIVGCLRLDQRQKGDVPHVAAWGLRAPCPPQTAVAPQPSERAIALQLPQARCWSASWLSSTAGVATASPPVIGCPRGVHAWVHHAVRCARGQAASLLPPSSRRLSPCLCASAAAGVGRMMVEESASKGGLGSRAVRWAAAAGPVGLLSPMPCAAQPPTPYTAAPASTEAPQSSTEPEYEPSTDYPRGTARPALPPLPVAGRRMGGFAVEYEGHASEVVARQQLDEALDGEFRKEGRKERKAMLCPCCVGCNPVAVERAGPSDKHW